MCCVELPYPFTDPVEFEIRFENVSAQPQTIRRWVDLIRPDGSVDRIAPPADVELVEGAEHSEPHQALLGAADPPGDYSLVMYWAQGGDIHSQIASFSAEAAVPGIAPPALGILLAALLGVAALAIRRRGVPGPG